MSSELKIALIKLLHYYLHFILETERNKKKMITGTTNDYFKSYFDQTIEN